MRPTPTEEHHILASEIKEKCWDPDWETFDLALCAKILARHDGGVRYETVQEAAQLVEQHNRDLMERWNEVTKEPPLEAKIRALAQNPTSLPSSSTPDATQTR